MIPILLDLRTGKTAKGSDMSVFWWTEGNGSCDCNRALAFPEIRAEMTAQMRKKLARHAMEGATVCYGTKRFIAIDVEGALVDEAYDGEKTPVTKEHILMCMNLEYANKLEQGK